MSCTLIVTLRAPWFNAWFVYLAARPVLAIDGTEQTLRWNAPHKTLIPAGARTVSAGLRYRGSKAVLGVSTLNLVLREQEPTELVAKIGWTNHTPFMFTER